MGLGWKILTFLIARPPVVAGEPMANLMLSSTDRSVINGAMFKLDKRIKKPDTAMNDEALESRLWEFLVLSVAPKTE